MARPKRNPVEKIKTKMLIHFLCEKLCIEHSGAALSHFFEGTRRASSKWKRFVEGDMTPSIGTINLILNKLKSLQDDGDFAKYFYDLWHSPLWTVLNAGRQESEYWTKFYKSMPVRYQRHVFDNGSSFNDSSKRRYPRHSEVLSIEKFGDLEGFAFLIALARDSIDENLGLYIHTLDLSIYRLFFAFCQHHPFKPFCIELWKYFKDHIILQDRFLFRLLDITRWQELDDKVIELIELDDYYLNIAEKIGFISNHQQARQFLYYFHTNNAVNISNELEEFYSNESGSYTHLSILAKKLNSLRKKNERIVIDNW